MIHASTHAVNLLFTVKMIHQTQIHRKQDILYNIKPAKSNINPAKIASSNGSAKKRGRPWGSKEKKKDKHLPHGGGRRRRKNNAHNARKLCMMGVPQKPIIRKFDIMSKRKYNIHKVAGERLSEKELETLRIPGRRDAHPSNFSTGRQPAEMRISAS